MYITEKDLQQELDQQSDSKVRMYDRQKAMQYAEIGAHILQINLQSPIFSSIQFPSLPRNWDFVMSKIEWPEKAMINPNGTLAMNPKDIDKDDAQDIAHQCFSGEQFRGMKRGLVQSLFPGAFKFLESRDFTLGEFIGHMLMEDTKSMTGKDIDPKSNKKVNTKVSVMSGSIVQAITQYIIRSTDAITGLIEMTGGASQIKAVKRAINTANSASW